MTVLSDVLDKRMIVHAQSDSAEVRILLDTSGIPADKGPNFSHRFSSLRSFFRFFLLRRANIAEYQKFALPLSLKPPI